MIRRLPFSALWRAPGPGRGRRGRRPADPLAAERLEPRQVLSGLSIVEQGIVARSESVAADPSQVVIGEIVRYRAVLSVAEGTVAESESRLTVNLPAGLEFLDDGTATVALVSDGGLTSSLYVPGEAAYVTGSSFEITPTAPLAEGGLVAGIGIVSFEFGSLGNADADGDEDGEFAILEFNVLVANVAGSGAGTVLVGTSVIVVDGDESGLADLPGLTVAAGTVEELAIFAVEADDETPFAGPLPAGGDVRHRVAFTVGSGDDAAALFDVRVAADLPEGMLLDPASVRLLVNGGAPAGFIDNSAAERLEVVLPTALPGDAVTVFFDAALDARLVTGGEVPLAVDVVAFSLPGATGSDPNPTGSVTPGSVGSPTGARDGSGGVNDLAWNAATSLFVFTVDLAVTKSAAFDIHSPGGPVAYTIVVRNDSLVPVAGAAVVDRMPADLADVSWSVVYEGDGSGPAVGGPAAGEIFFGDIDVLVDLAAGGTAIFTVAGTYAGAGGPLVNEVVVTAPAGPADIDPSNDVAGVETAFEDRVDLVVTISDGQGTYSPGGELTYTITVSNFGPGFAADTRVLAVAPPGTTPLGWTAELSPGVGGAAAGEGPLDTTATLPPGGTATYTFVVAVAPDRLGLLTTTVSVTAAAGLVETEPADNTAADTNRLPVVVAGADIGARSTPLVSVIDPATGAVLRQFLAYEPGFRGGVRVALGDVTGDGLEEIITAPGPGRVGEIRVFRQDGTELVAYRTLPFGPAWRGGVEVSAGDVDGDGRDDIVAARSRGTGEVRVFASRDEADPIPDLPIVQFLPFGRRHVGGATVTVADVGSFAGGTLVDAAAPDGRLEIVVGSGPGTRATVRVFDVSAAARPVATILPLTPRLRGGVAVAAGRVTGSELDDIIVTAGRGGRTAVEVYDGRLDLVPGSLVPVSAAFAALARPNAPLFVAPVDLNGNGRVDRLFASLGDRHAGPGITALAPTGAVLGAAAGLGGPLRIAAVRPRPAAELEFITTPSGLRYADVVVGSGPVPETGDLLTTHYTGSLLDGTVFDSSRDRGTPFQFRLGFGEVIAGWDEAFATMRPGGRRILIIPPELAYGAFPPPGIPANATLVFDAELLAIG